MTKNQQQQPVEPTFPGAVFSERFRKSYRYAFGLLIGTDYWVTDVEGDPKKWVALNLNPQQISIQSPFATAVTPTQGGGKVVESRGQILRLYNVSGTTGYLPPKPNDGNVASVGGKNPITRGDFTGAVLSGNTTRAPLVPTNVTLDRDQGLRSGFYAFHKLDYLFRRYGYLRRIGRTDVMMVWVDFKSDDYWCIEPDQFTLQRSSRKPFLYDYSISFKGIEPLETQLVGYVDDTLYRAKDVAKMTPRNRGIIGPSISMQLLDGIHQYQQDSAVFQTVSRFGELLDNGNAWVNQLSDAGVVGFQVCLAAVSSIVNYFQAFHDASSKLDQTSLALFSQLDNALAGWVDVYNEFTDDNLKQEANEWYLEVTVMSDLMQDHIRALGASNTDAVNTADRKFTTSRMRGGSTTDTMPETGTGSPDVQPLIGASGLDLVTDVGDLSSASMKPVRINHGEDIYMFALRVLGSINRFIDVVIINELQFPYIVSDTITRPAGCRAWGDVLLVPSDDPVAAFIQSDNDDNAPSVEGTADTSGTSTTLIDSTMLWRDDQWIGYTITAKTGSLTDTHVVVSNTTTTVTINLPWAITITPGTTTYEIRMVTFDVHRPVDAETRAYGRDLLVLFTAKDRATLVQGANGDLAQVQGKDNLVQAVNLRARCPIGHHPLHPRYGLPSPVGRPVDASVAAMTLFNTRHSFMADPRVAAVQNASVDEEGDKFYLRASLQPVLARTAVPIRVQVGG